MWKPPRARRAERVTAPDKHHRVRALSTLGAVRGHRLVFFWLPTPRSREHPVPTKSPSLDYMLTDRQIPEDLASISPARGGARRSSRDPGPWAPPGAPLVISPARGGARRSSRAPSILSPPIVSVRSRLRNQCHLTFVAAFATRASVGARTGGAPLSRSCCARRGRPPRRPSSRRPRPRRRGAGTRPAARGSARGSAGPTRGAARP